MTDQATVTINNIDYDTSSMSDADIETLNSMSGFNYSSGSPQENSDQLDAACAAFVQSLSA